MILQSLRFKFERRKSRNKLKPMYEPKPVYMCCTCVYIMQQDSLSVPSSKNQRSWGPNLDNTNPVLGHFKRKAFFGGIAMLHRPKKESAPIPKFLSHNTSAFIHSRPVCARCLPIFPYRDNVHPLPSHQFLVPLYHPLGVVHFSSASDSSRSVVRITYIYLCRGQFIRHYSFFCGIIRILTISVDPGA
jgi:hypothetical protein